MSRKSSIATQLRTLQSSEFPTRVIREGSEIDHTSSRKVAVTGTQAVPNRDISEAEFHTLATAFAVAHLLGALEHLTRVPAYIRQYRRTPALANAGATRASDLVYHLEGFLVRTVGLRDRTLQLCSAVCHTGLALNSVNPRAISTNSIATSTGISTKLKELEKLCSPYSQARNQVVHQHGLLDEDIRLLEGLLLASRVLEIPRRYAAGAAYRRMVRDLAEQKSEEIESFIRSAIQFTGELFTILAPQYDLKQRQLRAANVY